MTQSLTAFFNSSKIRSVIALVVLIVLAGFYGRLLYKHLCPIAGGADSSGYLNAAKMLSRGRLIEPVQPLKDFSLGPEYAPTFRPLGFSWGTRSEVRVPHYPIGMPWHMMILGMLLGWQIGPFLTGVIAAVLSLILMVFLARKFKLPWSYSIAGGAILSANPAWLFIAVQPMSDVLAAFWVLAAVLAAVAARERPGWAVLSGAAFGISVLVRPSDAVMIIPLMFALPFKPKAWGLFAAGVLPFGLYGTFLSHALYGKWLTTGYRGGIAQDMALGYFPARFVHYVKWLFIQLTPIIPLAWLGLPFLRRIRWKDKLLLLTWFLAYFLFYCFYLSYNDWWYVRFLLPGLPALILAALIVFRAGQESLEKRAGPPSTDRARWFRISGWAVAGLAAVFILATEAHQAKKLGALNVLEGEHEYRDACLLVKKEWPAKTIVVSFQASGAVTYYTDFTALRWDETDAEKFAVVRERAEAQGYQFRAMLFPFELDRFQKNTPGRWEKTADVRNVSLWTLLPD